MPQLSTDVLLLVCGYLVERPPIYPSIIKNYFYDGKNVVLSNQRELYGMLLCCRLLYSRLLPIFWRCIELDIRSFAYSRFITVLCSKKHNHTYKNVLSLCIYAIFSMNISCYLPLHSKTWNPLVFKIVKRKLTWGRERCLKNVHE